MRKLTVKRVVPVIFAMLFVASGSLMAQAGFGFRAGVTADPGQFHFGVHFVTDPIIPNLTFRPNLEVGVGSGTTVAANLEFAYKIPINKSVTPYVGAGPGLVVSRRNDNTDVGGGFNVLL